VSALAARRQRKPPSPWKGVFAALCAWHLAWVGYNAEGLFAGDIGAGVLVAYNSVWFAFWYRKIRQGDDT
jgi:hypothetical protein